MSGRVIAFALAHPGKPCRAVEYDKEPARSDWQRMKVNFLSLIHMDKEL